MLYCTLPCLAEGAEQHVNGYGLLLHNKELAYREGIRLESGRGYCTTRSTYRSVVLEANDEIKC